MIYVIKVEYKVCTVLKIGYTADKNSKKRFESYKNPIPLLTFSFLQFQRAPLRYSKKRFPST